MAFFNPWDVIRNSAVPVTNMPSAIQPAWPPSQWVAPSQQMQGGSGIDRLLAGAAQAGPQGAPQPAVPPDVLRNGAMPIGAPADAMPAPPPVPQQVAPQQAVNSQPQGGGFQSTLNDFFGHNPESTFFERLMSPQTMGLIQASAALGSGQFNGIGGALSAGLGGFAQGAQMSNQFSRQARQDQMAEEEFGLRRQETQGKVAAQERVTAAMAKLSAGEQLTDAEMFAVDPEGYVKARQQGFKPEYRTIGNQLLRIGPDGQPEVIHEAPREPTQGQEQWRPLTEADAQARGIPYAPGLEISNRGQTRKGGAFKDSGDTSLKPSDITGIQTRYRSDPTISRWTTVAPILKGAFESAGRDSRAADLSLTYAFAKVMDPESVVREGEQIMVSNTAALPDYLQGAINRLNGGSSLTPATRQALVQELHTRSAELYGAASTQDAWWRSDVQQFGLPPERVGPALPRFPGLPNLTQPPPNGGGSDSPPPTGPGLPMRGAPAPPAANPPPGGNLYDGVPDAQPIPLQAPPPPEQRVVGQVYEYNGRRARWTPQGWELVQ